MFDWLRITAAKNDSFDLRTTFVTTNKPEFYLTEGDNKFHQIMDQHRMEGDLLDAGYIRTRFKDEILKVAVGGYSKLLRLPTLESADRVRKMTSVAAELAFSQFAEANGIGLQLTTTLPSEIYPPQVTNPLPIARVPAGMYLLD